MKESFDPEISVSLSQAQGMKPAEVPAEAGQGPRAACLFKSAEQKLSKIHTSLYVSDDRVGDQGTPANRPLGGRQF